MWQGDSIRAKFWGPAVDKFFITLDVGKIYTFTKGRVTIANRRFNSANHNYELTFDVNADIREATTNESEDVGKFSRLPGVVGTLKCTVRNNNSCSKEQERWYHRLTLFRFLTLKEIQGSSRTLPFLADLCVVVKYLQPKTDTFVNRVTSGAGVKRQSLVADDTGFEMSFTLFNDAAEMRELLDAYKESHLPEKPCIVAIQSAQIREFNGGQSGSSLRQTHILVNPEGVTRVSELREWFRIHGDSSTYVNISSDATRQQTKPSAKTLLEVVETMESLPTFSQAMMMGSQSSQTTSSAEPGDIFTVIADVTRIIYFSNRSGEFTLLYPGCPKCNRKVTEGGGYCETCDQQVVTPCQRYLTALSLGDSSVGRVVARAFNDTAKTILGCTAEAMSQMIPPGTRANELSDEPKKILEYSALWRKFRLRIRARKELYAGEERKNVAVLFAEPLNYTEQASLLLSEIKQSALFAAEDSKKKRFIIVEEGRHPPENSDQQPKRVRVDISDPNPVDSTLGEVANQRPQKRTSDENVYERPCRTGEGPLEKN